MRSTPAGKCCQRRSGILSSPLVEAADALSARVGKLKFSPPIEYVYNPLEYARAGHVAYLERYGRSGIDVLLMGMNPGPFGMAQTGVPFGEVVAVREWLGMTAFVGKPKKEHPKRPIDGFACTRSEVSGQRVWGWAKQRFHQPSAFFKRFFITNYCPLVFMEASGRNFTPDKLPADEQRKLFAACDDHLRAVVTCCRPKWVIGVGAFAEQRIRQALPEAQTGRILHPSPASPLANKNWAQQAESALKKLGVHLPD